MICFGLFGVTLQFYDHRYAQHSSKVSFKVPVAMNVKGSSFKTEDYRDIIGISEDNRSLPKYR